MTAGGAENADELAALASQLAPTLVGLSQADAERRVAESDVRLSIRFAGPGEVVTLEYRFGRITAATEHGVVVRATPG